MELGVDELHTYRGRQGADVALLARRVRACKAPNLRCVGTSATLAGPGTFAEQRVEVARVPTRLFGTTVEPEAIIGETLRAATEDVDAHDPAFVARLTERVRSGGPPPAYEEAIADPLACWIERTLGIEWNATDERYQRSASRPMRGVTGAGTLLAEATGVAEATCLNALEQALLIGSRTRGPRGLSGLQP